MFIYKNKSVFLSQKNIYLNLSSIYFSLIINVCLKNFMKAFLNAKTWKKMTDYYLVGTLNFH